MNSLFFTFFIFTIFLFIFFPFFVDMKGEFDVIHLLFYFIVVIYSCCCTPFTYIRVCVVCDLNRVP